MARTYIAGTQQEDLSKLSPDIGGLAGTPKPTIPQYGAGMQLTSDGRIATTVDVFRGNILVPKVVTPTIPSVTKPTPTIGTAAPTVASTPAPLTPEQQNAYNMRAAGLTPEQQAGVMSGKGYAAPGSAASAATSAGYNFTLTPEQQMEADRQKTLEESAYKAATATYDPNQAYKDAMSQYQQRIDSINAMYNDVLNQSRIKNAPVYEGRVESRKFAQGRAGQIGSGTGEAGINAVTSANMAEQAAAEAEVNARRNAEINAIYGKVDDSVVEAKKSYESAKKAGGETYLIAIKSKQTKRAELLASAIKGAVSGDVELTPEEMKTIAEKVGVDVSAVQAEYNTQKKTSDTEKAKVIKDAEKAALEAKKTTAETAKLQFDITNWGKMTEKEKSQNAIEWYKAQNPTGTATEKKASALGSIASQLNKGQMLPDKATPVLDDNNKLTPEALAFMIQKGAGIGLEKKDILSQFGQFLYVDAKTGSVAPAYGLSPADQKIILGTLPVSS